MKRFLLFVSMILLFCLIGCSKSDDGDDGPAISEQVLGENKVVYDIMKDSYLWYDKVPDVDYTTYASCVDLLEALKYKKNDGSRDWDRWSFIATQKEFYSYYDDNKYVGIGYGLKRDWDNKIKVTFVFPSSPADIAGFKRGDELLEIQGKTIQEIDSQNLWDTIEGPDDVGFNVLLKVRKTSGTIKTMTLAKSEVSVRPVLKRSVIKRTDNGYTGYLLFMTFTEKGESELDEAFDYFEKSDIDELVVDIRYNSGGLLKVASYLGSKIMGKNMTTASIFTKNLHNSKYRKYDNDTRLIIYFQPLLSDLDLKRVIFITTDDTCSASETVMNAIRIENNIEYYQVGESTCGKPVGMYGYEFSDKVILPIEFKVANSRGDSDYFYGLPLEGDMRYLNAYDDLTHELGDQLETSLRAALNNSYAANYNIEEQNDNLSVFQSVQNSGLEKIPRKGFKAEIGVF